MYKSVYMLADYRYVCRVGPKGDVWADFAYEFAIELLGKGERFRILPIGGAFLSQIRDPGWAHWKQLQAQFVTSLSPTYGNIVCCELGTRLGVAVTGAQLAPHVPGVAAAARLQAKASVARTDVVYEPEFALAAYLVAGRTNVAITGAASNHGAIAPAELAALQRYDTVRVPDARWATPLRLLNIPYKLPEEG